MHGNAGKLFRSLRDRASGLFEEAPSEAHPIFAEASSLMQKGRLEDAISDLGIARDHLPESKQRPLKLDAISKFLKVTPNILGGFLI